MSGSPILFKIIEKVGSIIKFHTFFQQINYLPKTLFGSAKVGFKKLFLLPFCPIQKATDLWPWYHPYEQTSCPHCVTAKFYNISKTVL